MWGGAGGRDKPYFTQILRFPFLQENQNINLPALNEQRLPWVWKWNDDCCSARTCSQQSRSGTVTGGTSETLHFRTWPIGLAWPMTLPVSCVGTRTQLSHGNINCSVNKLVTTAVANLTLKMKTITFYNYCYLSSQYQYLLFIHLFLTSIINFVK